MSAIERRQIPRTKLEKLAYIHIEPDNGGIVLNVSDEGLAFHSMAPVEKNGQLLFSLKEQNRRIDVCGELIWTDEVQKIGGLRFTTLTNEAREQIANLVSRPEEPKSNGGSTLGAAFLRAFPNLKVRNLVPRIEAGEGLAPSKVKVRLRLSGFSGGLATGVLVSLLATLIFAFSYTHRQQFGESLIRVGEKLATKTPTQSTASQLQQPSSPVTPVAQDISATPAPALAAASHAPAHKKSSNSETEFQDVVQIFPPPHGTATAKNPESGRKQEVSSTSQSRTGTQSAKPNLSTNGTAPAGATAHVVPPNAAVVASAVPTSLAPPAVSLPGQLAASNSAPALHGPFGQIQSESVSSAPALPVQHFFDLGKFKQQQTAQELSDRVVQLGMRSSVVNKGHLWMSSYQVLVGPYLTESEEKKIHGDLVTNGIKALPFERGSRGFAFRSALSVGGSKLPVGELSITWETYVSEAKVKFMQDGALLASAKASWVSHPQKFAHNEYVYENGGGNSRPLLEVHFAGLDRALVFR
jgi:PilZ domain